MTSKNDAINRLLELKNQLKDIETENTKVLGIILGAYEKNKNRNSIKEEIEERNEELRKLNFDDRWKNEVIRAIDYYFNGRSSRKMYAKRVKSLDFSIYTNLEEPVGYIAAETLFEEMIEDINRYWLEDSGSNSISPEPPDILKNITWITKNWKRHWKIILLSIVILVLVIFIKAIL